MTQLYSNSYFNQIKNLRKKLLIAYFIVLGVLLAGLITVLILFIDLPYGAKLNLTYRIIACVIACIIVIFSFLYFEIPFGRCNKYYLKLYAMFVAQKIKSTATVLSYNTTEKAHNDGVDFYTMEILEWSNIQNDYVTHRIYLDPEVDLPKLKENDMLEIEIACNVLLAYGEILNEKV